MPIKLPTIRTKRLLIRDIESTDVSAVFRGLSNPKVIAHYGISYDTLGATQVQMDWFSEVRDTRKGAWWAICSLEHGEQMIGACGINEWQAQHRSAELGCWLMPEYWKTGLMKEGISALIGTLFSDFDINRLEAVVELENTASWGLLERLGFKLEGVKRECERKNEHFIDIKCYALLKSDWLESGNSV